MQDRHLTANLSSLALIVVWALASLSGTAIAADRPVADSDRKRPQLTDADITDHVERELLYDQGVPAWKVEVSTRDGVVSLTGSVERLLAKERAVRVVEAIKGVRAIIDRIEVIPPQRRTDRELRLAVKDALLENPATDAYEIEVEVDDGVVSLEGEVESWQEMHLAGLIAKGVGGIVKVVNEIDVNRQADRADGEIQREIEEALKWNVYVTNEELIDVDVEQGEVTLSGTIGSLAERRWVNYVAWVGGVTAVDDTGLTVRDWAKSEAIRKAAYPSATPEQLRNVVQRALRYDPRVRDADSIEVDVDKALVTLRGTVPDLQTKRIAEQDARNTIGVYAVRNELNVMRPTGLADELVTEKVRSALRRNPYVDKYEVEVRVSNGTAVLTGTVDTYFEKAEADATTAAVRGVVAVDNQLIVQRDFDNYAYDPYIDAYDPGLYSWYEARPTRDIQPDKVIREEIEDELFWSPFVDASRIDVTVKDGIATLTGKVSSWTERQAAAENAFDGGAVRVVNGLIVEEAVAK